MVSLDYDCINCFTSALWDNLNEDNKVSLYTCFIDLKTGEWTEKIVEQKSVGGIAMAKELELKYGCNPNQKPAKIFMKEGELPLTVLNANRVTLTFWTPSTAGSWSRN